jgi:hypothetical protein
MVYPVNHVNTNHQCFKSYVGNNNLFINKTKKLIHATNITVLIIQVTIMETIT